MEFCSRFTLNMNIDIDRIFIKNDVSAKRSQMYFFDGAVKVNLVSVSLDAQTLLKIGRSMSQ